ncbi:MAG: hypothetical protein Kow0042_22370 [Calditrichia bacterium]
MDGINFDIPKGWSMARVDELFSIQQGKQVSKKNRIGGNQRPFLRTRNVLWGRLDLSELDQMHFTENDEQRLTLQFGDLLLCEGGDVGRTAIWRNEIERCYYQNHLHRLRVLNSTVDPEFALFWFWYAFELGHIYFGRKNVTTIPNMSKSRLSELPIPTPPFPEQRKIAAILSLVQQAIEQQERLIALTTELKKALMHKLFTEGVRGEPQKMTEIGPLPESWEVVELGEVAALRKETIIPIESDVEIYIGLEHIDSGKLWWSNQGHPSDVRSAKNKFYPGDVLYGKLRPYLDKAVIAKAMGICSTDILVLNPENYISAEFLVSLLHSEKLLEYAKRTTSGVNHPRTSWSALKKFHFGLPQKDERDEIARTLLLIEKRIEFEEKIRNIHQSLFRTLLHQLMTGQVRVGDVDVEEKNV